MSNQKPSLAGVRSTGLEIKKRPQQATTQNESRVSTQQPNNPTPSNRGYA